MAHSRLIGTRPLAGNTSAAGTVLAIAALSFAGFAAAVTAGCSWTPGGLAWSLDRYTYESTAFQPQTVTLIDTRTMQPVRSWEVPVGQKLVMRFTPNVAAGTADSPDALVWDIWPITDNYGTPTQEMVVPPGSARRVDVKLRQVPELAGTTLLATAPGAPVMPIQQGVAPAPAPSPAASDAAAGTVAGAGANAGAGTGTGSRADAAAGANPGNPMGPAVADGTKSPTIPLNSNPRTPPVPPPAPTPAGVAVTGQVVAGRYYLVAARLAGLDADRAVGALNGGGVAARGLAKDGQVWVVVTSPSLSEAEFAHPSSAANRETLLQKVMAIGQAHRTAGGASNFSMASWELMK